MKEYSKIVFKRTPKELIKIRVNGITEGKVGTSKLKMKLSIPDVLALLPVRDIVVFPYMVVPLFVGRDSSVAAVDEALNSNRMIFLCFPERSHTG